MVLCGKSIDFWLREFQQINNARLAVISNDNTRCTSRYNKLDAKQFLDNVFSILNTGTSNTAVYILSSVVTFIVVTFS